MYLIEVEDPAKEGKWFRSAKRETLEGTQVLCAYLREQGFNVRYIPSDEDPDA